MTDAFFVTSDLGVSSRLQAQGFNPEVVHHEGAPRALFQFQRSDRFTQVLSDLASGTIPENAEDVAKARATLRTRAILTHESARSRP